jgi:hypothetical protein
MTTSPFGNDLATDSIRLHDADIPVKVVNVSTAPTARTSGEEKAPQNSPFPGLPEHAVDLDQLLTNVSVYWFTGTGASAANFLYETGHSTEWGAPGTAPQGWALFAAQPFVRAMMDPDHEIEHWSEFDRGGHFAAMETPDLLVGDVREFFRALR